MACRAEARGGIGPPMHFVLPRGTFTCRYAPSEGWRKALVMLQPRLAPILFSRQVQPAYICLPSRNGQGDRSCTCDLLVPNLWPRANARLLLTSHPENGCQTWTRTKTSGLTGRRATLTLPGNGAADRIPTCIVPFRRRMPHVFDHGSNLKLVGMAGFPPAASRSQAERSED